MPRAAAACLRLHPVLSWAAVTSEMLELPLFARTQGSRAIRENLAEELTSFREFGEATRVLTTRSATFDGQPIEVPTFVNEFWTARQRQASSLHEVSYRACFKPQLPRFFIERLTAPGERVYDPFMGRGTTPIEAALLGRLPTGCDINPPIPSSASWLPRSHGSSAASSRPCPSARRALPRWCHRGT